MAVGGAEADEVISALIELPEKDVRAVLDRAAREQGAAAVPLLERFASEAKGDLALAAVRALGALRDPAAAAACDREVPGRPAW